MTDSKTNQFTEGHLGKIYLKTTLPIVFIMAMNGLLTITDAVFLGRYVGATALAGVTLMFPVFMLIVSLATLIGSGMSSLLARRLGARDLAGAYAVFSGSHGLAIALSIILVVMFSFFGHSLTNLASGDSPELAEQGYIYIRISILCTPLLFLLTVHSDALRNEGRIGFMAAMSLLVSLSNVAFNYILIALLDMGVAGSAYGTALAQLLALLIILIYRASGNAQLEISMLLRHSFFKRWSRILALGAPQSLGFFGFALGSLAIIVTLQHVSSSYEPTITAYGIITRVMTFGFLPLLGLSHAMQTITGSNIGAQYWARSDQSLKVGLITSFLYCLSTQIIFTVAAPHIGAFFVDDPKVISEVARILPLITIVFFLTGPLMMIGTHFQACGDASRAAILSLTKPYLFAIPLTFLMANIWGEIGIWLSGPSSEILMLAVTIYVLSRLSRTEQWDYGLFRSQSMIAQRVR